MNLLGSHSVHFLADNRLHLAQDPQTEGQPGVDSRGCTSDVTGSDEELMGIDLGISRVLAQSAQEV